MVIFYWVRIKRGIHIRSSWPLPYVDITAPMESVEALVLQSINTSFRGLCLFYQSRKQWGHLNDPQLERENNSP